MKSTDILDETIFSVNELVNQYFMVEQCGNRINPASGKTVSVWKVKDRSYENAMDSASKYITKYRGF